MHMATDWNDRNRFKDTEFSRRNSGQNDRSGSSTSPFGIEGSYSDRGSRDYYNRDQGYNREQGSEGSRRSAQDRLSEDYPRRGYEDSQYGNSGRSQMNDYRSPSYQPNHYEDQQSYSGRSQNRDYNDRDRMLERGSGQSSSG